MKRYVIKPRAGNEKVKGVWWKEKATAQEMLRYVESGHYAFHEYHVDIPRYPQENWVVVEDTEPEFNQYGEVSP